jgi:MFS family permease
VVSVAPVAPVVVAEPSPPLRGARAISGGYSAYIITMFAVVTMFNISDHYCMAILLDPIRKEFGASDTEMGILSGASYGIVFALAGLPLARLADTRNRRNLMAISLAFWSAATALCGAAGSFAQLFLTRSAVAAGESATQPALISMIGDLFERQRRGLAIALSMMGGSFGIVVGSIVAGAATAAYGWRTAFVVLGLPGIIFAIVFWLTVPEPIRGAKDGGVRHDPATLTTAGALLYLATVPTAWRLILASTLLLAAQGAWAAWLPSFFLRVHHLPMARMSASYGIFVGLGAVLSMIVSGFAGDWLAKRGERRRVLFLSVTLAIGMPFFAVALLVDNVWLAWGLIVIFQVITGGAPPVVAAAGAGVLRPRARALWTSLYNFSGFVVGGLTGPVIVGFVSDSLTARFGDEGLRYGMLVIPAFLLPAALIYWWASLTADQDAARVSPMEQENHMEGTV